MNIKREEAKEISNAIYDAGFRVYGLGNYDINREELCNILMIALTKKNKKCYLSRYYEILHDKVFINDKIK